MSKSASENKLRAAKIVSVHGVRGLVKVQVFLEDPFDLVTLGALTNRDGSKIFDLEIRGQAKGTLLCAVGGVNDRDAADRLRGTEIFVDRDALPDVEDEEEFYIADLVGMDVRSADTNSIIGRVRAVQDHGAGDIIVLNYKEAGRRDEMFAFTYDIFPDVNVQERYLTFLPPEEVSERDEEE